MDFWMTLRLSRRRVIGSLILIVFMAVLPLLSFVFIEGAGRTPNYGYRTRFGIVGIELFLVFVVIDLGASALGESQQRGMEFLLTRARGRMRLAWEAWGAALFATLTIFFAGFMALNRSMFVIRQITAPSPWWPLPMGHYIPEILPEIVFVMSAAVLFTVLRRSPRDGAAGAFLLILLYIGVAMISMLPQFPGWLRPYMNLHRSVAARIVLSALAVLTPWVARVILQRREVA